jgi:hypothetical protein
VLAARRGSISLTIMRDRGLIDGVKTGSEGSAIAIR